PARSGQPRHRAPGRARTATECAANGQAIGMTIAVASGPNSIFDRFSKLNWGIITILCILAVIGVAMHFSESASSADVWTNMPLAHGLSLVMLLAIMILMAMFLDARFWLAIAYPLYAGALLLLLAVAVIGETRLGATRWLSLGPLSLQPSELMKVGLVLALARYYHQLDPRRTGTVLWSIPPFLMIGAPAALIMHQPDLGTAMLIVFSGIIIMFVAGLLWRIIIAGAIVGVGGALFAYKYLLHGYQR